MSETIEPEHVVAEEFQPLIALGAMAARGFSAETCVKAVASSADR